MSLTDLSLKLPPSDFEFHNFWFCLVSSSLNESLDSLHENDEEVDQINSCEDE